MFAWLKRVFGGSATTQEKTPQEAPVQEHTAVPHNETAKDAAAEQSSPLPQPETSGRDAAQQYLLKLQDKIGRLADDFANGTINRQQFQELYAHYQREMRTVETLLQVSEGENEWGDALQEGESVLIRQQHAAKATGYAIYENSSGMPISTLGKFEVDPALFVPMLSSFRSATAEIFGGSIQATAIEGGRWLCFVPGKFTTMMAIFTAEPAQKQLDFLEQLHHLFEKANRALLADSPVNVSELVFPHEHFLGKWKR